MVKLRPLPSLTPYRLSKTKTRSFFSLIRDTGKTLIALSEPCNYNFKISLDINTLCKDGKLREAMAVMQCMDCQRIDVVIRSFSFILHACGNMRALAEGRQLHAHLFSCGLDQNICLATTLVTMYGVCKRVEDARQVFDKMSQRSVLLWNAMISGYAKNELREQAVSLYREMQRRGIQPNNFTFPCTLKVCGSLSQGKWMHGHVIRSGFDSDVVVSSAIVAMYAKFGFVDIARQVFDKMPQRDFVSSWNAMIAGYAQSRGAVEALEFFREMLVEGVDLNPMTVTIVLPVCSSLENLCRGKEIHGVVLRRGFDSDVFVGSALIDMYAKCRNIEIARRVFDRMSNPNVVAWTSMIAGYAQNAHANDALKCFRQMQLECLKPNLVTTVSVLPACSQLAALQQGKEIHQYAFKSGFDGDILVGNALIDMYAKCGSIAMARLVFDKIDDKDVVSWSAMIAGYGMHGKGATALELFYQMQDADIEPGDITFIGVLSACSHAGLVDEGWHFFNLMRQKHRISPKVEHYACMVDLLCRAGKLHEAQEFIKKMPLEPSASVWGALLGACRVYGNLELGEYAFKSLLELEPNNGGNYVLLANIYAEAGRWDDVGKVRVIMNDRGLRKVTGCSWILVKHCVHTFIVGDESHPQMNKIHSILKNLVPEMKAAGYVPDFHYALYENA